jgi:LuxR family transcriptional regulator, maltose regulon positive regulatory protein
LRATILQAKLERPRPGGSVVSRPRLMRMLDEGLDRRLTLVCAAPGFGKTTLLSAWLETCPYPTAWLSLDAEDAGLSRFVTYFVAALRSIFPDGMGDTRALLYAQLSPPLEVLTTTLINDISRLARPFVLVLDDYHNAQSAEIDDLLGEFLRHWPQPMHLLLGTRADPTLPLAAERAKSHLQEIRGRDLRFNRDEIATYVERLGWPANADAQALAARLEEQTEGWIAGLYLATLPLRDQDAAGLAAAGPKIDSGYMMDYLADEILARQPPAVQAFLVKTSILERLCAPLAQALTDGSGDDMNCQSILENLQRTNLFTFALDDRGAWYRYHHLLQEMLRRQLEERYGPQAIAFLHGRAGAWFEEKGFVEEALNHALAAGDFSRAAGIVERNRQQAMNNEQWQRLESWLSAFPAEFIAQEPRLMMLELWLAHVRFRILELPELLAGVEAALQNTPLEGPIADQMRGEIDALRSWLAWTQRDGPQALALSSRALSVLPTGWHRGRGLAWMASVAGNLLVNGVDRAYAVLHGALAADEAKSPPLAALLFVAHGFLDWITGDLPGLLQTSQQMSRLFSAADVPDSINWTAFFRGVVHYHRNNLAAAEADFASLVGRPYVAQALVYLHSACALAMTLHAQGHPERARQVVDDAMLFALEVRNSAAAQMLRILRAELAFQDGDVEGAAQTVIRYGFALTLLPMLQF